MSDKFMLRTLLYKLIILLSTITLTILCFEFVLDRYLKNNYFYKISSNINTLILGNSRTESALNDNYINNTVNLSQSADSYFYTYYKCNKLIEANNNIQVLIVSLSDGIFSEEALKWNYDDLHLSSKYPKYSHLISTQDKLYLCFSNFECFVSNYLGVFQEKACLLYSPNSLVYKKLNWGGYLSLIRDNIPRLIFEMKESASPQKPPIKASDDINVRYLLKIASYCKENNIQLILIRTPHYKYYKKPFEAELRKLLENELAGVTFWDYADYPLKDDEFGDFTHLNYKGAKVFSRVIGERLKIMNARQNTQRINFKVNPRH